MGRPILNYAGAKFARLTVINVTERRSGRAPVWLCRCDCGKDVFATIGRLRQGVSRSCGCLRDELAAVRMKSNRRDKITHGKWMSPAYQSWRSMIQRCHNPRASGFKKYGGRGITVCGRWRSFESFFADMGPRPDGTSIHRIDNELGYFPGNCRWATPSDQAANRRGDKAAQGRKGASARWGKRS